LFWMFGDGLPELRRNHDRLAVDGHDHIAGPEPPTFARLANVHRQQTRVSLRQHADLAEFEAAAPGRSGWRHPVRQRPTVAKNVDRDFAIRVSGDGGEKRIPRVDGMIRDRKNTIAGLDVATLGRRALDDCAD